MALIKLRHVNEWTDRHGRKRIYFRRPGCKAIPLPGPVGAPAFMEAYNDALAGTEALPKTGMGTAKVGTFAALALSYLNSARFKDKRPETQRSERGIINGLIPIYGGCPVSGPNGLRQEHVQKIVDAKANKPSAARKLLAVIRMMMAHAVTIRQRKDNPAIGVTRTEDQDAGLPHMGGSRHCRI